MAEVINLPYTPLTWLLAEILSVALFFLCLVHAAKQDKPGVRMLELSGFILAAGLFENVGVAVGIYDYNLNRMMMFGKVPIAILLFEAVIVYAGFLLAEHLRIPKWALPLVVGFFSSWQDMTVDPSAVFDLYTIDGVVSGRWNWWNMGYENGLFGIPFFNFSGWLYMIAYYSAFILIGRWIATKLEGKKGAKVWDYSYPVLSGLLVTLALGAFPPTRLLLFGSFTEMHNRTPELVFMIINLAIPALILLFRGGLKKKIAALDFGVIFGVPIALHLWDILIAFARGIEIAYFPSVVVGGLHIALLMYYFISNKKLPETIG